MTILKSRLQTEYVKSTEHADPKIRFHLHVPLYLLIKMVFLSLLGRAQYVEHTISESEIEDLSKQIVKWRLVKKLRQYRNHRKMESDAI
jgi:hypothetical protein